jgi:hypothetical protein
MNIPASLGSTENNTAQPLEPPLTRSWIDCRTSSDAKSMSNFSSEAATYKTTTTIIQMRTDQLNNAPTNVPSQHPAQEILYYGWSMKLVRQRFPMIDQDQYQTHRQQQILLSQSHFPSKDKQPIVYWMPFWLYLSAQWQLPTSDTLT